jgi:hypothetical protein
VATSAAVFLGCACGQAGVAETGTSSGTSALTTIDGRILGFEQTGDWAVTNGSASVAGSSSHVEGEASLALSNLGYVELTSAALPSLAVIDGNVTIDLLLPNEQPNPYWLGQLQLFVDCPSASVNNAYVGASELTGLPLNVFNRIQFTLPSNVTAAMAVPHSDLRLKVVLNVPQNSATYLLDRLHLNATDVDGGGGGGTSSISVSVTLPNRMKPWDLLLVASNDLMLADRADPIHNGKTTIVNTGDGETNIGVEAKVGNVWSAGPVVLRDRAHATGDVTTKSTVSLGADVVIEGQVTQNASAKLYDEVAWTVTVPTTTLGQRDVEPDQQLALDPGRYGSVSVKSRAVLSLHSGIYFMDSLTLEPESLLDMNETTGPVIIYVVNNFIHRGVNTAQDGNLDSFLVVVMGEDQVAVDSAFDGTLVAPNASVVLATVSGTHTGAFFAKHVIVRPDAVFQLRPYAHWDAFYSPDDAGQGLSGPIPLPDTPAGLATREHLATMSAVGPGVIDAYNTTLANLRAQVDQVVPTITTAYEGLPELAYHARWSLIYILAALESPVALDPLTSIALSPAPPAPAPMEPHGTDFVGEEQMIGARAVRGITALAAAGNAEAENTLLDCISTCEDLPRVYAVQGYISYGDPAARKADLRARFGAPIEDLLNLQTI